MTENKNTAFDFINTAKDTIKLEQNALNSLSDSIDSNFTKACELLINCSGKVVVIGIGKSGHIANKIAATLASTGTAAFFIHPAEASHGDLGMIDQKDIIIAISNSGNTPEIIALLPILKKIKSPLISITNNPHSKLSQTALVNLHINTHQEACPLNLAPTSTTTSTLVLGDALAISLLKYKNFTSEDFALSHPGGTLGKQLLLTVNDVMHQLDHLALVSLESSISNSLIKITQKKFGAAIIIDKSKKVLGIFTDGDLRRSLDSNIDIKNTPIGQVMTTDFQSVAPTDLAKDALNKMEKSKITSLLVLSNEKLIGMVHIHDLIKSGVK